MELVYLWVDSYKNIKNQGFNFSPRFECEFFPEYNEDGKLKDNCKLEIIPKDYVSIFPENINITAIVGENGSGKSSTIDEIINNIIFNTKDEYERHAPLMCFLNDDKNTIYIYSHLIKDISQVASIFNFRITHFNDNLPSKLVEEYKTTDFMNTDFSKKFKEEYYKSFFYIYNNSLETDSNYHNVYEYNPELLSYSEIDKSNNTIDLEKYNDKTYDNLMTLLFNQNRVSKEIENFFVPTKLFLNREILIPYFKYSENALDEELKYQEIKKNLNEKEILKLETILYLYYFSKNNSSNKIYDDIIGPIRLIFKKFKKLELYNEIYDYLQSNLSTYLKNIAYDKKNIRKDNNRSNDIKELNELEKILLLLKDLDKFVLLIKDINNDENDPDYEIKIDVLDDEKLLFLKQLPAYLKIDFDNKTGRKFNKLSSGERNLLKLMFSIENIIQLRKERTESLYIILDEIEHTFHPDWQKRILNWLIEFIKHYDMKFHIIVASHSPFILSDIPKENVIFLKNGKQDNPDIEQTFGANIHTLLSHGFFMENGLMGEFAKSKINEIKDFYEKVKKSENPREEHKKEFENNIKSFIHIQNIIGEPFLQTIIKNYLDDLHIIFSDDKTLIDKELAELEKRKKHLESLKNAKN